MKKIPIRYISDPPTELTLTFSPREAVLLKRLTADSFRLDELGARAEHAIAEMVVGKMVEAGEA